MTTILDEQRIVVGVDGSLSAKRALQWAAEQAKRTGALLMVVTVANFPSTYGWAPPVPDEFDRNAELNARLDNEVKEIVGEDSGVTVLKEVLAGHPAAVLTELSKRSSLVVLGSRGRGAFVGMLLGSVGLHVASQAHCPVVIVRDA